MTRSRPGRAGGQSACRSLWTVRKIASFCGSRGLSTLAVGMAGGAGAAGAGGAATFPRNLGHHRCALQDEIAEPDCREFK